MAKGDTGRALAEKIREIICDEWAAGADGPLESAVIYQRLLREGSEVPAYAMSAILNAFRVGGLIEAPLRHQSEEEIRKHGDLSIRDVNPDLCAPPYSPNS